MATNAMRITFEIDPIVNLTCLASDCDHNIQQHCNLKNIWLTANRACGLYEPAKARSVAAQFEVTVIK